MTVRTHEKFRKGFPIVIDEEMNIMLPDIHITSKDLDRTTQALPCPVSLGERILGKKEGTAVPDIYNTIEFKMPPIAFHIKGLNYFLTTGLLMPGDKVVKIDCSDQAGLKTPYDFLLAGQLIPKTADNT